MLVQNWGTWRKLCVPEQRFGGKWIFLDDQEENLDPDNSYSENDKLFQDERKSTQVREESFVAGNSYGQKQPAESHYSEELAQ